MFKLFVPLIRHIDSQTSTNDPDEIPLGDEATDLNWQKITKYNRVRRLSRTHNGIYCISYYHPTTKDMGHQKCTYLAQDGTRGQTQGNPPRRYDIFVDGNIQCISTAYGEGAEHAFFRLLKEIFDSTKNVLDIFNWGFPSSYDIPRSF